MAFFILAEDLPSGHIHLFPRTTHFSGTTSTSLSIGNETTANILKETNNAIFKIFFVYFILVCNMIPVSNRYIQNGYILTVDKKLIFFTKILSLEYEPGEHKVRIYFYMNIHMMNIHKYRT